MDRLNRVNVILRGEALNYFQSRLKTGESETDLLNTLVLEAKWYCEKAAAPALSPLNSETTAPTEILKTGSQQPQQPPKREYVRDGFGPATLAYRKERAERKDAAEVAYMKEKAIQKAKREGALERLKDREDFRTQALADREEYEYALRKKRQDEKDRLTYRGPKVNYPGMDYISS